MPMMYSGHQKRRKQLFLHMGPVALTICSVLLIGLMAVLYLSQQAQAVSANQQLQSMRSEQNTLTRQNQDLTDQIANAKSPASIADQASKMGLVPADPNKVQIIKIHHLQPLRKSDQ
jgi:cell division protein FtsL